jgi:ribA/ribD-fused uncharacterized protein
MKITDQFVFFYVTSDPFSNFHRSKFIKDGLEFSCGEQWIMYCKAIEFGDTEIANQILKTKTPSQIKSLGRQVKNYNDDHWDKVREERTYHGLYEKDKQNPKLYKAIMDTGTRELVEASPNDKIWGVGLADSDPRILNKANWRGRNILGSILMRVRAKLEQELVDNV